MGERDLALGSAEAIQYTAGSGPPEPLVYGIRPADTFVGRGPTESGRVLTNQAADVAWSR